MCEDYEIMYPEDVERIRLAAFKLGHNLTPKEAARLWEDHSDMYCAGWLILPPSDHELEGDVKATLERGEWNE